MIASVYKEDMAVATGSKFSWMLAPGFLIIRAVTYLFRTTGQVLGVSLSNTIFQAVLFQKLRDRIQGPNSSEASRDKLYILIIWLTLSLRPCSYSQTIDAIRYRRFLITLRAQLISFSRTTEIIPTLEPRLQRAAVDSYADALRVVFICQIAINVLGFLACLAIQENPLP